jgi:hypothetical protein
MKTLVSAVIAAGFLMAAAPAGAAINGGFEAAGATTSTTFVGSNVYAYGVAPGWNAYNNSYATTTVGEVSTAVNHDPFAAAGFKMFKITSSETNDGLYQLPGGFGFLSADFFVLSGHAQLVAASSRGDYLSTVATTANNTWQHLTLNTTAGAGEIALYTSGAGSFYVDNVVTGAFQTGAPASSVTTWSGGVPEPASWALMIIGFASAGAMLRHRRAALAG